MFKAYFSDRNYALLYTQNALKGAAALTMGLFIGGWLYALGFDLHWIILYHAANFAIMGVFSPLGAYLAGRNGMAITFGLSFLAFFLSLLCLSFASNNIALVILGVLLSGLANGLQNPPDIILHAAYVDDQSRGRAFSVVNCLSALLNLIAILGSGWLLESFGLLGISVICGLLWIGSLLCIVKMDDKLKGAQHVDVKKTYADIFAKENRNLLGLSLGFQFLIIASFVFVPIILYLSTQSFQDMAYIAAMAIIAQMGILILQGLWVDKTQSDSPLRLAIAVHSAGLFVYALFAAGKATFLIADTLQRTGLLMYFGTIFPRVHKAINAKRLPLLSFGAIFHMAICFWELIVLSIMAYAIYIHGATALPYCLLVCAAGSFISVIYCKKLMQNEN